MELNRRQSISNGAGVCCHRTHQTAASPRNATPCMTCRLGTRSRRRACGQSHRLYRSSVISQRSLHAAALSERRPTSVRPCCRGEQAHPTGFDRKTRSECPMFVFALAPARAPGELGTRRYGLITAYARPCDSATRMAPVRWGRTKAACPAAAKGPRRDAGARPRATHRALYTASLGAALGV